MTERGRRLAGLAAMVMGPAIHLGVWWFHYWPEPDPAWSETKMWTFFAVAVLISTVGLYVRGRQRTWFQTALVLVVYSAVLAITLIFADGFIACANGDCF
jgi:hypothetical protein